MDHSPRETNHLDEMQLARFLEGRMAPWERARVMAHLQTCPDCARVAAETRRLLAAAEALPPLRLEHPVEHFLSHLRRWIPLPAWAWHAILMVMIFVAWFTLLDPTLLTWLRTPLYMGLSFTAVIAITTYFVWLQKTFRELHERLWEEGVPAGKVDAFQARYLAPLHGRFPGRKWHHFFPEGGWLFIALALFINLTTYLRLPPKPGGEWYDLGGVIIGLYNVVVMTAVEWGWLWGGRYLMGLARLLQTHRPHLSANMLARARMLGFQWTMVSSLSMLWYLIAALITGQAQEPGVPVWAAIVTTLILQIWGGYLFLEITLYAPRSERAMRLAASARMGLSTLSVVSVIGAAWYPLLS